MNRPVPPVWRSILYVPGNVPKFIDKAHERGADCVLVDLEDSVQPAQKPEARAMLAGTLKGVVSQRLVPSPDGLGRVPTCEILRMTGRVRDMILNPDETGRLPEVIAEGGYYGMQSFDQALLEHFQAGRVSMEDALKAATHPHDFKLLVSSDGLRSTSVESVMAPEESEDPDAPGANGAQPSVSSAPGA